MTEQVSVEEYTIVLKDNLIIIRNLKNRVKKTLVLAPPEHLVGKLNIQLSNRCNMNCVYCSEGTYNRHEKQDISIEDAQIVIVTYLIYIESLPLRIESVRLSFDYGGEPFCEFSNLTSIICYFREQCIKRHITPIVQITTNGVFQTDILKKIQAYVDEFIVSIDGPRILHEKYRVHSSGRSVFDQIISNAKMINKSGKLYQISSVITQHTIENVSDFVLFFVDEFPEASVRIRPVMALGDALTSGIEKIPMNTWRKFVTDVQRLSCNRINIIDTKPEKNMQTLYRYGCDYMNTCSWFYWVDGSISCCTERETTQYRFGVCKNRSIDFDKDILGSLYMENDIDNLSQCFNCLAKYFCAGGCPKVRKQINCEMRRKKYAKLLIDYIKGT